MTEEGEGRRGGNPAGGNGETDGDEGPAQGMERAKEGGVESLSVEMR